MFWGLLMKVYKTSPSGVRFIVRSLLKEILNESDGGSIEFDLMPNEENPIWKGVKPEKIKEADMDYEDPENWEASCGKPDVGGRHSFHGDRMYPCGPDGKQYMNIDQGPFLGHSTPSQGDHAEAEKYIAAYEPDELVAYSRGGAMAVQTKSKAKDYTFLAPAWDRDKYGAETDGISGIKGKIYHGAGDRFVPVNHSCRGAKNSGIDLYVHPTAGHGTILKHYKNGSMDGYKKHTSS